MTTRVNGHSMSTYRLWIQFSPDNLLSAQPRGGWTTTIHCVVIAALLAIPQVERVVGVRAVYSVPLLLLYPVWIRISQTWLVPRARHSKVAFDLLNAGDICLGMAIVVGLPVASGNPVSILWVLAVLFAGLNGADYDYGPSWILLLAHTLSPFAGVPFYLLSGASVGAAVGGPLFVAITCFIGYHYNAVRRSDVRSALSERDELRRKLAEEKALRERERIARDLHDSVGASLSTAALYADLLAQRTDPESVRNVAEAIAATTREGILELRGLLDALAPDDLEAEAFCDALRAHAQRVGASAGVDIRIILEGDASAKLPSALRFGIARVFQEALSNAVRHSGAKTIDARLVTRDAVARLELSDDGCGFDPRAEAAGRGVEGMRARMNELGGRFEIGAGPQGGTRIFAELPLTSS